MSAASSGADPGTFSQLKTVASGEPTACVPATYPKADNLFHPAHEKRPNLAPHLAWVALVVKEDEAANSSSEGMRLIESVSSPDLEE